MPADLKTMVEKMIADGVPEDQIGAFIKEHTTRQANTPKPLAPNGPKQIGIDTVQSEPETYWGGAWKGWNEGSRAGLRGFVKGVVPGAVHTVINTPQALVGAGIETAKGIGNLADEPEKTLRDAYASVKGIPAKMGDTATEMANLGRKDPEALGRQIGDMTGSTMTGIAASGAVPLLPKPLMRGVGDTLETLGTKGRWPIMMVGAHQIASGNPAGVLTMMAPGQMAKGGRYLRLAGTEAGAAANSLEGQYLKLHQDIQTGNMSTVESRLTALQDDLIKRHADAKLPEQLAEVKKQQAALDKLRGAAEKRVADASKPSPQQQEAIRLDKQKQKDQLDVADAVEKMHDAAAKRVKEEAKAAAEEAKRVAEVMKAREGKTAQEPTVVETVRGTTPEGAVHTKTTRYVPEDAEATAGEGPKGPAAGPGPAPADGPSAQFPGLSKLEVSLLRQQGMSDDIIARAAAMAPKTSSALEGVGQAAGVPPPPAPGPRQTYPIKPAVEDFGTGVLPVPPMETPAAPAAPARPKLDLSSGDKSLLDDLVKDAKAKGYTGDEQALKQHLYDKVVQVKDSLDEYDSAGTNPHQLRQAIKSQGGFNVDKETALNGELNNLKSFDKSLVSTGDKGLTVDGMLEYLGQDPRFNHIQSINDLLDASKDAAGAGKSTLASKLKGAGVEYGKPWWKQVGTAADASDLSFAPVTEGANPYGSLEQSMQDQATPVVADRRIARDKPSPSMAGGRTMAEINPQGAGGVDADALYNALHGEDAEPLANGGAQGSIEKALMGQPSSGPALESFSVPPDPLEMGSPTEPMAPKPEPIIAASKSRSNAVKNGLTKNDTEALKQFLLENPDAGHEDIANHLANARAQRQATYRINGGLDAAAKRALALDES